MTTRATFVPGSDYRILTKVNGDAKYNARTTRRAVGLLFSGGDCALGEVALEQTVETPIGSGFGASGASATSAVYAVAAAAGVAKPKAQLALCAHRAEIIERTGLGTVSVVYDAIGAGAITVPGKPGEAKFVNVKVPKDIRLVTAYVAPYDKREALSSRSLGERISRLGLDALQSFLSDATFDTLIKEGERFSKGLGLESPEVKKLIRAAKSAGAIGASQNMIGYSVHSVVHEDYSAKVAKSLSSIAPDVRVDTFEVGSRRACALPASRRSRGP